MKEDSHSFQVCADCRDMKCAALAERWQSFRHKWLNLSHLRRVRKLVGESVFWRPDCTTRPADYPGHETDSRPLQKICSGSPRQYLEPNKCASNRSRLCLTIKTAISTNVARRSCSAFRSQISAGSPAEPVWGKFNPNQMAHNSFSRTTNSRSSPQSQLPRLTNDSSVRIKQAKQEGFCEGIAMANFFLVDVRNHPASTTPFSSPQAGRQSPRIPVPVD